MPHSISPEPAKDTAMHEEVSQASVLHPQTGDSSAETSDDNAEVKPVQTGGDGVEDMFDDDSEDDEFASSAPQTQPATAQQPISGPKEGFSDPEVMRAFYQRLFPFRHLFQWLNHSPSPSNDFAHREFAFTLPNDAYLRYQSFPSADLLKKQCVSLLPSRFEIGPVYSTNPRDRKTLRKASMFRPISKELVFDVDLTDYDSIRTCCEGAKICDRCWQWITMAIKVVNAALRDDFGFKHIMWVYSGRRGAHAWVCDKRARAMDDGKRRAIAGYLELLRGGDKGGKKVTARRPLHPHIQRSLELLRPHFLTDILSSQDPLQKPALTTSLLHQIPDDLLRSALQRKWDSSPGRSSLQKWNDIKEAVQNGEHSKALKESAINEAREDIVLEYTYPRLDAEVSKKLNHLLKSPFCVHPGTGRVCVPIDVSKVEEFDPFDVPTVTELLAEIDAWDAENMASASSLPEGSGAEAGERKVHDYQKTRLKPYVEVFSKFVNELLRDEAPSIKRERDDGAEAMEF